jgi:hypothetical protein
MHLCCPINPKSPRRTGSSKLVQWLFTEEAGVRNVAYGWNSLKICFAYTRLAKMTPKLALCVRFYVWYPLSSLNTLLISAIMVVAFINKLLPFDPQHPRYLRLQLGPESEGSIKLAEYDTEESARDWRREISGMSQLSIYLQCTEYIILRCHFSPPPSPA